METPLLKKTYFFRKHLASFERTFGVPLRTINLSIIFDRGTGTDSSADKPRWVRVGGGRRGRGPGILGMIFH